MKTNSDYKEPESACQVVREFKTARRISTPLIAIQTSDNLATIQTIANSLFESSPPMLEWNAVQGIKALNEYGRDSMQRAMGRTESVSDQADTQDLVMTLEMSLNLEPKTLLFLINSQRVMDNFGVIQALANLRNPFKETGCTLVMLCCDNKLPPELRNDVFQIEEEMPNRAHLSQLVLGAYSSFEVTPPDADTADKAVDALAGLAAFPAEQAAFMSMKPEGIDLDSLWDRKRQMVDATPGLSIWHGAETYEDIGGLQNIKDFLFKVVNGTKPPKCVVFIDEIEKALAGSGSKFGDSSGVSQDQLGTLLAWMQDSEATGIICVGVPGTSKSMLAKATGNMANIPTIQLDVGAMKGSLVGESEQKLRAALRVVKAISSDEVLIIATSNNIEGLPPELRRRFTFGTYMFDLPNEEEREAIWKMYLKKYRLPKASNRVTTKSPGVDDHNWTGAEIKQCCDIANRLSCEVYAAAAYIVPVAQSAQETINKLRERADGKFISASQGGVYHVPHGQANFPVTKDSAKRAIQEV